MKVERVSYDVMTPSAARGLLEAILWKPAIRWIVKRIDIIKPIRWTSLRRNEIGSRMSNRSKELFIEDNRQQRAGLFLKDVEYVITALFELTDKAGEEDSIGKFADMFIRRASHGQCFQRPYLGCREFPASFTFIPRSEPLPEPIEETKDLGWMLFDIDYRIAEKTPKFFRASMNNGRIDIPEASELKV